MRARALAGAAGLGLLGAALWWRNNPSACPYGQRWMIELPHPLITRERLREVLDPRPGERLLEIGPGTGYYTLEVAEAVAPGGRVEIFDIQEAMLDHTMRAAALRGVDNVAPARGDAAKLPYEDTSIDGAFLVTVLGEIPDDAAALRELARVLKPGGRLVVGEIVADPHFVSPAVLRERAEAAGLRFERRSGPRLGYFARFSA
jgi:ubiquinone/menaquinone biosynthesis C-methylase UbiE